MGTGLVNLRNDSLTHLVKYPKSLTAAATAVPLRLELSKRQVSHGLTPENGQREV
jgi:hypothetical protein